MVYKAVLGDLWKNNVYFSNGSKCKCHQFNDLFSMHYNALAKQTFLWTLVKLLHADLQIWHRCLAESCNDFVIQ